MNNIILKILFLASILPVSLTVFTQEKLTTLETGIVINSGAKAPVEGATVVISPGNSVFITNEQGKFSFFDKDQSPDSIFISAIGFQPIPSCCKNFLRFDFIL